MPLAGVRLIVAELHPNRLGIDACSDLVALIMGQGFSIDIANTTLGTVTFQRRSPVNKALPEQGFETMATGKGVCRPQPPTSPPCAMNEALTVPAILTRIIIHLPGLVGLRRVIVSLRKTAGMLWPRGALAIPFSAAPQSNSDQRPNRNLRESL